MELNQEEQFIEDITNHLKQNGDVSNYKKDRKVSGLVTLLSQLNNIPKAKVPHFDFMRVKNQILDRIAVPAMAEANSNWFFGSLPRLLRIGTLALGSILIIVSLTLGTAVASLNSQPGEALYPIKQIVENIQLKLAPADQQPALQIQFATNRVDELNLVLQQQQDGEISANQAQKIVANTVKDLQKSASAVATSTKKPKAPIAASLADLSNKLKIASIRSEGEVKIELEKTIKDIELAGMKVEGAPLSIDDGVSTQGKLTAVTDTYLSIGSAKFLVTKDTKYVNIKAADLSVDQQVDIDGQIKDNKTYALTVTLIADTKPTAPSPEPTPSSDPDTTKDPQ